MATRIAAQPNPKAALKAELVTTLAPNRQIIADANTFLALTPVQQSAQSAAQIVRLTQAVKVLARELVAIGRLITEKLDSTT